MTPRGLPELRRAAQALLDNQAHHDRARLLLSRPGSTRENRDQYVVSWHELSRAGMALSHLLEDLEREEATGRPWRCPCGACRFYCDGIGIG